MRMRHGADDGRCSHQVLTCDVVTALRSDVDDVPEIIRSVRVPWQIDEMLSISKRFFVIGRLCVSNCQFSRRIQD